MTHIQNIQSNSKRKEMQTVVHHGYTFTLYCMRLLSDYH